MTLEVGQRWGNGDGELPATAKIIDVADGYITYCYSEKGSDGFYTGVSTIPTQTFRTTFTQFLPDPI